VDIDAYNAICREPDVFSRGALHLSFRILRHYRPGLALALQNCMAEEPLPKPPEIRDVPSTDQIRMTLDSQTVREILVALSELADKRSNDPKLAEFGGLVVLKTLMIDWIHYSQMNKARAPA
jgi:hypothetical protein